LLAASSNPSRTFARLAEGMANSPRAAIAKLESRLQYNQGESMTQNASAGQVKFLRAQLEKHINDYAQKRDGSKRSAYFIKVGIVCGGALTTIILGLKSSWFPDFDRWLSGTALIISAGITGISAFETFNDPYWKWVRYRTTLVDLYEIRDDLDYLSNGSETIPKSKLDALFDRLKIALKKTNQEWLSKRAKVIGETSRPRKVA
jgi:hypothetical protein